MARLIYSALTSLDGYVADETGDFDWAAPDEEVHAAVNDLERTVGTYLYGRRMYDVMAAWETMPTGADQSAVTRDFADIWRGADKVVYSTTLDGPRTARTRVERSFDPAAVRESGRHGRARRRRRRLGPGRSGARGRAGRRAAPVRVAGRRRRRHRLAPGQGPGRPRAAGRASLRGRRRAPALPDPVLMHFRARISVVRPMWRRPIWAHPGQWRGGSRRRWRGSRRGPSLHLCALPLASRPDRVHRRAVEPDANGRPSAFTLAQASAEVKGLTLQTDTALEQVRELQRHLGELAQRDEQLRARERAARIRRLAAVTVVLWLATLIVVLAHM